jgi:acyl-coenzyme A thioesterase 9
MFPARILASRTFVVGGRAFGNVSSFSSLTMPACSDDDGAFAGEHHSPITALLWKTRSEAKLLEEEKGNDAELSTPEPISKAPSESRVTVQYAFKSDPNTADQYKNAWGYIRKGRVLEDLDALAGNVAFHHCKDDNPNTFFPNLVTASVDNMRVLSRITMDADVDLVGSVAWTGNSSMVINLLLTNQETGTNLIDANFTFVARHPTTGKAMKINKIEPQTEAEKSLYSKFEELDQQRRYTRSLPVDEKKESERKEKIERLTAEGRVLRDMPGLAPGDLVPMFRTRTENSSMMHPQHRNMSNKIFGGLLMRRAFEAAFDTCYTFGGSRPHFLELERVAFKRPVDIGNLVKFVSHVTYTTNHPKAMVHVEVEAYVVNPEKRTTLLSNVFNFTFALNLHLEEANATVKHVLPQSRTEADMFLRGEEYVADNR